MNTATIIAIALCVISLAAFSYFVYGNEVKEKLKVTGKSAEQSVVKDLKD